MKLTPWKPRNTDLFRDFFESDFPSFGLPVFPLLDDKGIVRGTWPALDVEEDNDNIHVKADLPGLKKEEIDISVHHGILTIKGERKSEIEKKEKNYHRVERAYGSFQRSLDLGVDLDDQKVKANYANGVLEITLPKTRGAQLKKINIE